MVEYAPYPEDTQPAVDSERYFRTSQLAPSQPFVEAPVTLSEITGPLFAHEGVSPEEADLTAGGKALGQLMVLAG
ncbi:MAG: protocatechuate 3,4-dioxygenase subunit beta, partial [Gammaproteobacteria bacterium]|nr:protocatechuate 3,4-dioxygenase subunit beta [Gammaproteobacteria bacterium]